LATRSRTQLDARKLEKESSPQAEKVLVEAYSYPPTGVEELQHFMVNI
jgi:hypothetical protein